jgi:hypothetical protein
MSIRTFSTFNIALITTVMVSGCASTRQISIDHPSTQAQPFQPLPGFQVIDGDDYYVRLTSEFEFKGDNVLKSGCSTITPSYEKGDLSAALIYSVRNDVVKLNSEASGFLYQATTGKCNFKFDAKKFYLTPWIRLDSGKETQVDYSFHTNANSDLNVSSLVSDVNTASGLLALTGVGMGVAVMGQFAGQWVNNNPQTAAPVVQSSAKQSAESHSLPAAISFAGKTGTLNQSLFKVYEVEEGGVHVFGTDPRLLGVLKLIPEIIPSLLLKNNADGIPDARDLSLEEINNSPIKSAAGEISLQKLIEQSKHPAKPNLKPDWANYADVEGNCRKLKLVMKDLGFNKFDRNAVLYYFLAKNSDWKNYNITGQKALAEDIRPNTLAEYRSKDFGQCLAADDYAVMKAIGLPVNTQSDWRTIGESRQKKEQLFSPLKSIERQLLSVLKNPNTAEMEQQLFPLLTSAKNGEGTVLLQNHLGDFGLETLLNSPAPVVASAPESVVAPKAPAAPLAATPAPSEASALKPTAIPGEGVIVSAHQLAQVFSGLAIGELSCARPAPEQQGKPSGSVGILLFTTQAGSPRAKGGAMEFEFTGGKIIRIAFQLPSRRDFEQDLLDNPEVAGCRIDPSFLAKLH